MPVRRSFAPPVDRDALHIGNAMRIRERCRLQHDHELARAGTRRLDVDAENARPRGRVDTERLRRCTAAFQSHLDLTRRDCLEGADVGQMDRESRCLPYDERRILREQFDLPVHRVTAIGSFSGSAVAAGSFPPHAPTHIASRSAMQTLRAITCLLQHARARFVPGVRQNAYRSRGGARAQRCDMRRAVPECGASPSV